MPSSFADLVFARERIKVGLKRGKFDYVSSIGTNARRIGATGAKKKEGDTHAVTSKPAWIKPPQISHGTHQYAQHHPSFLARAGDSSNSTPVQTRAPAPTQREPPQAPAPTPTRPANNTQFGAGSNATRNFPPRPALGFTPIPMMYEDLLPSLIANWMDVISPGRIVATYPSAGGRRVTRGMRVPRKEYARSRHQRLFEENVGKTGKYAIYELLSERFGSCIYARGRC